MAVKKEIAIQQVASSPTEGATILTMLERVMASPDVPVEKVTQLYELHQRAQADKAKRDFMEALSLCQEEMEPIKKDAANKQTHSKYATHTALDAVLRPIYTRHGFALSNDTGAGDGTPIPDLHVRVLLYLSHKSGHERRYQIDMPCDGKGPKGNDVMSKTHAAGSAFSYGRRYLEGGAFNVVFYGEDDDGNRASGKVEPSANEPISATQLAELTELAKAVGADSARFCKFYGIQSMAEITVASFEKAKAALNKKRA